jgi:hypothetical protein
MILLEYEKAVADIKKECSNMKYGIFLSHHEMKKRPEKLANVVETDEWIETPEEMFETREAALAKLKEDKEKYSPCIREMRGNGGVYYDCKVYFVAACEYRYEEDEDDVTATDSDDTADYVMSYEDGFEVAPFERHLKIEPKKFKVKDVDEELIVDGCKVTTEYDEVYFKCKAEKLESYVGECYSDEDALDEMADNEEWYSHSYRQNGNEVEEI